MSHRVKLSHLSRMTPDEREETIQELLSASPEMARSNLSARIREYELRHAMSTERMLKRWRRGEIEDTAEIARWLFLASARNGDVVE